MSNAVYIVGSGMTRFGRIPDGTVKSMTREAVTAALADAGIEVGDVQSAFFSNTTQSHMEGQLFIRGQIALRAMGFEGIPIVNVENACASGATALNLAAQQIKAGECDVVLAAGAEKLWNQDRARMFSVFDSGWDISTAEENQAVLLGLGDGVEVPQGTMSDKPYSLFMDVYAALGRFHMRRFGSTREQLAAIAAKNHRHAAHNAKAQYSEPRTAEAVLAAPPISYPLTVPMCAPVSDGAAAAVLCNQAGLRRLGIDRSRAIEIKAAVIGTGVARAPEDADNHLTAAAARRAYEIAGVGPKEISVAEVHDATAVGELVQSEALGFFAFGEGGPAAARGETSVGGRIPINTSGGLESKGHPIGATGLGQIHELVTQLRGEAGQRQVEGASLALAENGGGFYGIEEAVVSVIILGR